MRHYSDVEIICTTVMALWFTTLIYLYGTRRRR